MRAIDYARQLFCHIRMDNPPVDIAGIIAQLGIALYYEDFSKLDGIALKSPGLAAIIVNRNLPETRQRFTIAHELAHIIMPHRGEYYVCYPGRNKAMEKSANKFAAEILMPKPMVLSLWEKYATNPQFRIEVVAGILKVSKAAFYARIRELELANK